MIAYSDANIIHPRERDAALFGASHWPHIPRPHGGWKISRVSNDHPHHVLSRRIVLPAVTGIRRREEVEELVVRFPSAPIYGTHREYEYQLRLHRHNYHGIRVIRSWLRNVQVIDRVYLICNGLNEVDKLGFYYKLASLLLRDDPHAIVIVRPIPGHLSRFPLPADFAERPLDTYLADSGNLFRQFLRYMLESQWLLSILVPHRTYRVAGGAALLAQGDEESPGRSDPSCLAKRIFDDWMELYRSNFPGRDVNKKPAREVGPAIELSAVQESVDLLRALARWTPAPEIGVPPDDGKLRKPALHSIGYSLGGFVAQSVFFSWPFAVSTCTTIASGGALRDLAPTAFAHPEEWSTVLYSLRYEIENAMLSGLIAVEDGAVAGIAKDTFTWLLQTFYEVFLQEFGGEYRSRVSEFVERLLFVVGGADPIVRVENVQKAAPPGGINLVEIAKLGHFIAAERGPEWREFWLPQVAQITSGFAIRGESVHARTMYPNWWNRDMTKPIRFKGMQRRGHH